MSVFLWMFEVAIAVVILLLEGLFHVCFWVLPTAKINALFAYLLRFYDKNIQPIHIEGVDLEELTCDCCLKENARKINSVDNLDQLEKEAMQMDLTANAGSPFAAQTPNLTYESMLCVQCKKIQLEPSKRPRSSSKGSKEAPGTHGNHVMYKKVLYKLLDADFVEMANYHGYQVENHYAVSQDGYILGLHRILPKSPITSSKGVVFFQHGFMQNSECFIARGPKNSLPYILSDLGYDVWLGNSRGNKYSHKHVSLSPKKDKFWDFCLDQLAMFDLPAMLTYITTKTAVPKVTYIGFSQGTAIAFAGFSSNPEVANKVKLFIALAPAARVKELKNQVVSAISTSKPQLLYLLFGRQKLLGFATFWRKVLHPTLLVKGIDFSLKFLFGWDMNNVSPTEKAVLYSHLYSYSSVKCLVHWFQITHTRRFQMYDDNVVVDNVGASYKNYLLPDYSPSRIKCPMALFYGLRDTIPQMEYLLAEVPKGTYIHKEDDYEHLDFIWAENAPQRIFPKVVELIQSTSSLKSVF